MTYDRLLQIAGNWAAILTAFVALVAYGGYRRDRYRKRRRLEEHLKDEKGMGYDGGQRSVLHLVANLGMTESEVLDAAFRSRRVRPVTTVDERGRAEDLMFEYDETGEPAEMRSTGRARF